MIRQLINRYKNRKTPILPGQIWVAAKGKDLRNPFSKYKTYESEVIEVRSGYVNYKFLPDTGIFNDESMEESTFRYVYRLKQ